MERTVTVGIVRATEQDEDGPLTKVDIGGDDLLLAEHFADSGDDSAPLPDDSAALAESPETGGLQVTGYHDATQRKAQPGEKRIYSRNAAGVVVAEVWLHADGAVDINTLGPGTKVTINGLGAMPAQSMIRGEDWLTYFDAILTAVKAIATGVPVAGPGLATAFDAAVLAALPLRLLSISQVGKVE